MKFRLSILIFACLLASAGARGQRPVKSHSLVSAYADSLRLCRERTDSLRVKSADDSRLAQLFLPLTFYHSTASHFLRLDPQGQVGDSLERSLDRALIGLYLHRPDLVSITETRLQKVGAPLEADVQQQRVKPDLVKQMAPDVIELEAGEGMNIIVKKPNFWTLSGDYYLQFLQNYVSDNWYKGGESNYSMLGSITMQANYNNKQKVKWDNKLELKLGYQTTKGDSIHKYKASEDLIRYTTKLGLQATKKWYYTVQLVAQTQFTHSVKSNDRSVYSDFMSPFKLNLSVGMDYSVDWLSHRLKGSVNLAPLALNWKYVDRLALATRYGLDEGHHTLTDYGSECTVDLTWTIADNIKWKTRLYGYTTYKRAEIEWENTLSFQFNKYISTNVFLYPRFDDGVTRSEGESYWQFKEYASVGFSYSF